jgi:predicted RNA-binding Zn-ribbon protein involved in translation (DUF1610 family)
LAVEQVILFPQVNELIWTLFNLVILGAIIWVIARAVVRRQVSSQFVPPAAAPQGGAVERELEHPCPRCQAPTAAALPHDPVKGKITAFKMPVKAFAPTHKSTLTVFVCPACGYAEWYADHPEQFR